MINKDEFKILDGYRDLLSKVFNGISIQVTRKMFLDISPIVKIHADFTGSMSCAYCVTKLCKYAYDLMNQYDIYIASCDVMEDSPKPKRGRPKKNV